jgi:hypothetical protein
MTYPGKEGKYPTLLGRSVCRQARWAGEASMNSEGTMDNFCCCCWDRISLYSPGWPHTWLDCVCVCVCVYGGRERLGFELRALHLQRRCSATWATFRSILLWLFWRWVLTEPLAWAGLKWLGLAVLLILASHIARITGMSHQCLARFFFFFLELYWGRIHIW